MAHWWVEDVGITLQIVPTPVKSLNRYLYNNCWIDKYGEFTSPMNVRNCPELYPYHANRTLKADNEYPILLYPNGAVFDGMHRLLKAYCQKITHIDTITIPEDVLNKFIIKICTDELYDIDLINNRDYRKTIKILYKSRFTDQL